MLTTPTVTLLRYTTLFLSVSLSRTTATLFSIIESLRSACDRRAVRQSAWARSCAMTHSPAVCTPCLRLWESCIASSTRLCRSEEHTSELQSPCNLVCRLLLDAHYTDSDPPSLHDALPICEFVQNHRDSVLDHRVAAIGVRSKGGSPVRLGSIVRNDPLARGLHPLPQALGELHRLFDPPL